LIQKLQRLDPDLPVVLSKDEEGNGYHHLYNVYEGYYAYSIQDWELELVHREDFSEVGLEDSDRLDEVVVLG
jgi:hypothetical protein